MISILPFINRIDQETFAKLRVIFKDIVRYGPFAGTLIVDEFSWGDACLKLLGLYEHYLHGAIALSCAKKIDGIINVGCAEGYYAVGLGRVLKDARVHAFDISVEAQEICRKMGRINGLESRLDVGGLLSARHLAQILELYRRPLLFIDAEGGEEALLRPNEVPGLSKTEIICECHDWLLPLGIGELMQRFDRTHHGAVIQEEDLRATDIVDIADYPSQVRMSLICEKRGIRMKWLHLIPRDVSGA